MASWVGEITNPWSSMRHTRKSKPAGPFFQGSNHFIVKLRIFYQGSDHLIVNELKWHNSLDTILSPLHW